MALTADRNTQMKDGELISVAMAVAKVFAGSLVAINASGYATPGAASAALTYFGRAEETVDNSAGSAGGKTVMVRRGRAFKWGNYASDAITQAELGKPCFIFDDYQVAKTSADGARSVAGIVLGVETDGVWVGEATRSDLTVAAALDFASIAAAASADLTITVPGAAVGDAVSLGLPAAPTAGLVFNGFVSAANTVTVRATNITAGAVDAVSATYRATVHKA